MEQSTPDHKRTWTVAGVAEDEVHRGGQKHKKTRGARKSKARDWGTGVNAIPVG
jgi:nucleolar protein 6